MATNITASLTTEGYNQTGSESHSLVILHWLDYVVFSIVLLFTLFIGFLFRFLDRKKKTENDFLYGAKEMSFFPVAVSLFMSGAVNVAVLRNPLEVYYHGIVYWVSGVGCVLATPIIAHVFAALFHLMELSTSFQFLEIRFGFNLRQICSIVYGIITLIHSAASLHVTGVALSQVSATPTWLAILMIGVISLSYTSLGGLKAVVWAHLFHCCVLLCSMVPVLILTTADIGGVQMVWNIAKDAGKLDIVDSISPNPLSRSTLWGYLFGSFFWFLCTYSYEQFAVQRYTALKSVGHVIGAVYTLVPFVVVFTSLYALLGLVMFAHYQGCDPLEEGVIHNKNLLLPMMAASMTEPYPGVMGLFIAGISCAALSYASSSQISLATTWLHDIAKPLYKRQTSVDLTEIQANSLVRVLALAVGVATVSMAFIVYLLTLVSMPRLIMLTIIMFKVLLWPIIGLYVVGVIFRFINAVCAMLGALFCLIISILFAIGVIIFDPNHDDVITNTCVNESTVVMTTPLTTNTTETQFNFGELFAFSPLLYPLIGPIMTSLFALLFASFYCCCCKEPDIDGTEDASGEFDTEGFHVDAPGAYRHRIGYKEVPSLNEDNHSQISGQLPKECLPMFLTQDTSHV